MFSRKEQLIKKTGPDGVGRYDFLKQLSEEFKVSKSQEGKRQVLANLANFAYDPINYEFIRQLEILDIFLNELSSNDREFVHFASAAVCNLCLDPAFREYIINSNGVYLLSSLLNSANVETILNALTTLIYIFTPDSGPCITTPSTIKTVLSLQEGSDPRCISTKNKVFDIGESVTVTHTITADDVKKFAELSGDTNPVHFENETHPPIVHGALLNSLVSGVIGTKLPGPGTLVVSQFLNFPDKCFVGETVNVLVVMTDVRKILKVRFECKVEGDPDRVVLYGDAKLFRQ